jgi:hypothetical protein
LSLWTSSLTGQSLRVAAHVVLRRPPICGWLFDSSGDYVSAAAFTAANFVLGFIALFTVPSKEAHDAVLGSIRRGNAPRTIEMRPKRRSIIQN